MAVIDPYRARVSAFESIALWLLPDRDPVETLSRLRRQAPENPAPPVLLWRAILHTLAVITLNFVPALEEGWQLFFAVAVVLAICFGGGNPQFTLMLVVVPGIFVLNSSYAYVRCNPAKRGALYQGVHTLNTMAVVLVVQIVQHIVDPRLTLTLPAIRFGFYSGILSVSGLCIVASSLRPRGEDPLLVTAKAMSLVSLLWIAGASSMLVHNPFPDLFPGQRFLSEASLTVFAMAMRVRLQPLEGGLTGGWTTIRQGFEIEDLQIRLSRLFFVPKGEPLNFWEILGFILILISPVSAYIRLAMGKIPLSEVDWVLWIPETVACASWFLIWPVLRGMARELKEGIQIHKARSAIGGTAK